MHSIFDSHAHYDDEAFDEDREALLSGLKAMGVDKIVNVAARLDEISRMMDMVRAHDFMWAAIGVHPSETYDLSDQDLQIIEEAAKDPKVKAIGEIGLDYHYDDTDKPCQKEWFARQIRLALKLDLPVVIHSRDAAADTYEMLKQLYTGPAGGVIHCFSYEKEMARQFLDLGFYIGVGGVLTFKNARKLKEVVEYMPMDRLLLETDCPYLAPVPFRGQRNDSSCIRYVVDAVAQIRGMDPDEVRRITNENACRMYRIHTEDLHAES